MMIIPPELFPEFPPKITEEIAFAILRKLQGSQELTNYFVGGITDAEEEDLYLQGSFTPPSLVVLIDSVDIEPLPTDQTNRTTVTEILMIHPLATAKPGHVLKPATSQKYIRSRLVSFIEVLLMQNHGVLEDESGECITEALTRFQRIGPPTLFPGQLRTRIRVAHQSYVTTELEFVP